MRRPDDASCKEARGLRHHDLHGDDAARGRARRHQPRAGVPGLRRAGLRQERGDRGDPGRARSVRADERHPGDPRRARRQVPARLRARLPRGRGAHGHLRGDRGDLRDDPGAVRSRRRRRALRAVLRLLQGERPDGGSGARLRDPGGARLAVRSGRGRARGQQTHARDPRQLAPQPHGEGVLARRARSDRAAVHRARPRLHHRRGLRAHGLRGRARADGDAARDARAYGHHLELREDVLADGLEDRMGGRAAGIDEGGAGRAPVHHVRDGDAAPARGGVRALRGAGLLPGVARRLPREARLPRRRARAGRVRRPAAGGDVLCVRRIRALRLRRRRRRVLQAPDRARRSGRDPAVLLLRRSEEPPRVRAVRVLQGDADAPGRGGETGEAVRIALLQMDLAWEDVPENHRRATRLLAEAKKGGALLAVLPEMFSTGFSMDAARIAQPADGPSETFLRDQARELGLWILASVPEQGEPAPRNMAMLVSPGGAVVKYAKIHPFSFAGEDKVYSAGDRVVTAEVEGVRVTPLVCYDLRFPEPFRAAAAETDLFVVVANWPDTRREHWRTLLRARAIEYQAYVGG